jgi:hypothetical protein
MCLIRLGLRRWREAGGLDKGVFGGFSRGRRRKFILWGGSVLGIGRRKRSRPRRAERDMGHPGGWRVAVGAIRRDSDDRG